MQEAERRALPGRQRLPVVAHGFQQAQGAHHVGLDEGARAVDGTVDVAFSGEIQHRIRLVLGQQAGYQRAVTDVTLHKHVVRVAVQAGQRLQVAGVGEHIEVDDLDTAGDGLENEVTANESGAAGDKPCGHYVISCSMLTSTGTHGARYSGTEYIEGTFTTACMT